MVPIRGRFLTIWRNKAVFWRKLGIFLRNNIHIEKLIMIFSKEIAIQLKPRKISKHKSRRQSTNVHLIQVLWNKLANLKMKPISLPSPIYQATNMSDKLEKEDLLRFMSTRIIMRTSMQSKNICYKVRWIAMKMR